MSQVHPAQCPACSALLPEQAILCVACGYHLKLGHHLATAIGAEPDKPPPIDTNPYSATLVASTTSPRGLDSGNWDLTDYGAARAKAVVADADSVLVLCIMACLCGPIWFLLFPWFGFRLYCWYDLRSTFRELRYPNSFSPHGELAARFDSAHAKLMIAFCLGGLLWILAGVGLILQQFSGH